MFCNIYVKPCPSTHVSPSPSHTPKCIEYSPLTSERESTAPVYLEDSTYTHTRTLAPWCVHTHFQQPIGRRDGRSHSKSGFYFFPGRFEPLLAIISSSRYYPRIREPLLKMGTPTDSTHAAKQDLVNLNPLISEEEEFRNSVRSTVHQYVKAGSNSVSPTALTNILRDAVGNPLGKLNQRMSSMEVTLSHILKGINNITAGQGVANGDLVDKLDKVEISVKKVAAIIPKMSEIMINNLDSFQWQIDQCIESFNERMAKMQRLQVHHLCRLNEREQRSRSWSVRVHNFVDFSMTGADGTGSAAAEVDKSDGTYRDEREDQETDAAKKDDSTQPPEDVEPQKRKFKHKANTDAIIYEKIIRPSLEIAKQNGEIDVVPEMKDAVEMSHPLFAGPGRIPCFIFRFHARPLMFSFLRHKAAPIKAINEANKKFDRTAAERVKFGNPQPIRVGADLTDMNRRLLTWLYGQEEISYSKISGNRVVFQRKDMPGKWYTCANPFGNTIEEMCQQPVDVRGYLLRSLVPTPPFLLNKKLNPTAARRLSFNESFPPNSQETPMNQASYTQSPMHPSKAGEPTVKLFRRSSMVKSMDKMRRNFEREVLALSEELDLIRDSQEIVANTAEELVNELTNAIADANTLADGEELSESDCEEDEMSDQTRELPAGSGDGAPAPNESFGRCGNDAHAPNEMSDQTREQATGSGDGAPAPNESFGRCGNGAPAPNETSSGNDAPALNEPIDMAPAPMQVAESEQAEDPVADVDGGGGAKRSNAHLTPLQPPGKGAPALTDQQGDGAPAPNESVLEAKKAKKPGRPKTRAN